MNRWRSQEIWGVSVFVLVLVGMSLLDYLQGQRYGVIGALARFQNSVAVTGPLSALWVFEVGRRQRGFDAGIGWTAPRSRLMVEVASFVKASRVPLFGALLASLVVTVFAVQLPDSTTVPVVYVGVVMVRTLHCCVWGWAVSRASSSWWVGPIVASCLFVVGIAMTTISILSGPEFLGLIAPLGTFEMSEEWAISGWWGVAVSGVAFFGMVSAWGISRFAVELKLSRSLLAGTLVAVVIGTATIGLSMDATWDQVTGRVDRASGPKVCDMDSGFEVCLTKGNYELYRDSYTPFLARLGPMLPLGIRSETTFTDAPFVPTVTSPRLSPSTDIVDGAIHPEAAHRVVANVLGLDEYCDITNHENFEVSYFIVGLIAGNNPEIFGLTQDIENAERLMLDWSETELMTFLEENQTEIAHCALSGEDVLKWN